MSKVFTPTDGQIMTCQSLLALMEYVEVIGGIVNAYKTAILADGKWPIQSGFARLTGTDFVSDPSLAYLMSDEHFKVYTLKCHQARDVAGLYVKDGNLCPLEVAENALIKAQHAFIDELFDEGKLTVEQLLKSGFSKYHKYIDFYVRQIAPLCHKPSPIFGRKVS